ncbi:MAG: LysM peptidoglycan-binding domain-containing protein [Clostridiales bacterium]|nr:LysM peptidoglycan-binding domain-containing protein [Clostridiales bacterium]
MCIALYCPGYDRFSYLLMVIAVPDLYRALGSKSYKVGMCWKRSVFMENLIRLSASVISNVGTVSASNQDNFYMNGHFLNEYGRDSARVSIDNRGQEFIFAITNGMDATSSDLKNSISGIDEIRKIHDKFQDLERDMVQKLDQLYSCVDESGSLVHSVLISNGSSPMEKRQPSSAVLYINEGKAALLNTGSCRGFILRDGVIKQLAADFKKAERLLKLGIITNEQAEALSNRYGIPTDDSEKKLRKSEIIPLVENDIFVLCSNGVVDVIDEDTVFEIASLDEETDFIASTFVKEAVKNGAGDDITVIVIRILRMANAGKEKISAKRSGSWIGRKTHRENPKAASRVNIFAKREDTKSSQEEEEQQPSIFEGIRGIGVHNTGNHIVDSHSTSIHSVGSDGIGRPMEHADEVLAQYPVNHMTDKDTYHGGLQRENEGEEDDDKNEYVESEGNPIVKALTTAAIILVIGIVLFVAYRAWMKSYEVDADANGTNATSTIDSGVDSGNSESSSSDINNGTGETTNNGTVNDGTSSTVGGETVKNDQGSVVYTVKKGDNLMAISKKFYDDPEKYKLIMEANNIKDADLISIGQKLIIPPLK